MSVINIDTATQLDFIVSANHSFSFSLSYFENDGTTPVLLTGTRKMTISKDAEGIYPLMTLTEGNGITIAGNMLTISCTKTQNTLEALKYFFAIRVDVDSTTSYPEYKGNFTVNYNVAKL